MHGIQPWTANPRYWSIDGEPRLLIGGSREDNLFQIDDLEQHLDDLVAAGGNYIRNTMSDRDPGDERAFLKREDGFYDLEQWNPAYWQRFERLLCLCDARGIVVQIEVWDRFDHSREPWLSDPYNPAVNCNYSHDDSGLAPAYPEHPGKNLQPFFRTIPALEDNTLVLGYQQCFIDRLLDISLPFKNVLYCMNNETHEAADWGLYWIDYIQRRAAADGRTVCLTDMFDGNWQAGVAEACRQQFDNARYAFIDVSQINAWRCTVEEHWSNLAALRALNAARPRPLNNVKIYGADGLADYAGPGNPRCSNHDGISSFWMNLLGGCASARFHRPPHGLHLSELARASLRTVRLLEQEFKFWDLQADPLLYSVDGGGHAFTAHIPGQTRLVFLSGGGRVCLPAQTDDTCSLRCIDLSTGSFCDAAQSECLASGENAQIQLTLTGDGPFICIISLR